MFVSNFTADSEREAVSFVATIRGEETVALIRVAIGEYRTVIFSEAEQAEADELPGDGPTEVAGRFLRPGEALVSVH